jgi:hypothetical protein
MEPLIKDDGSDLSKSKEDTSPEKKSSKESDKQEYDPSWLKGTSADSSISVNKKRDFSNPVYKQLSKINGKINKMNLDDLTKSLNELKLDTKYILLPLNLIKTIKNYYISFHMNKQRQKRSAY